ncbi:MAG: lipopolysaccharide biosynthesis protein [Clostridia bacterium]|nr:lipopolysaccharide biosynthesis protein [Clostridia bacterium]
MDELSQKTAKAVKWSSITEFAAKIITPLINMLLARILAPEAFGMLATVTMVISFAEVFVESGFQKFLIQHQFHSAKREHEHMSVAFWANLIFSFAVWAIIIIFRDPLAAVAGNEGLGLPVAITGVTIPLFGIIGIQNCQLRKNLEFKKLFYVRFISSLIPLVVTLPLALLGLDYWSLIIGNIVGILVRSVVLAVVGKFIPSAYFSFADLKFMLRFGIWTMLDGIVLWMTNWIDALLIAHYMSEYYLGLYKNSTATITSLFAIVTAALTPVLFSALSKLQEDPEQFNGMFLKTQRMLCMFLLPLGVGAFFYKDLITDILFGAEWAEAADIVGIMAITTALRTIFISLCGDAYRAKGRFYIPLIRQLVDLAVLVPVCVLSVQNGFWSLVYARAFVKLDLIVLDALLLWMVCRISPKDTLKVFLPSATATVVMTGAILLLQMVSTSFVWSIVSIGICILLYFPILFCFPTERTLIFVPIKRVVFREKMIKK